MGKLTLKQQAFTNYYIETQNATKAAKLAGYAGNDVTLGQVGAENLKKPQIKAEIDRILKERSEYSIASAEEVLNGLTSLYRGEVQPNGEMPTNAERIKAGELLGKTHQLFTDKRQIELKAEVKAELSTAEKKKRLSELLHKFHVDE